MRSHGSKRIRDAAIQNPESRIQNSGVSGTNSPVIATLTNNVGSIGNKGSAAFASEDAGHVTLTSMTLGNTYPLTLTLASAGDQAKVLAQLAKNAAFTNVKAFGTDVVTMEFTAPAATGYFAWDNVHTSSTNWYLGGNLISVKLAPASLKGTLILVY